MATTNPRGRSTSQAVTVPVAPHFGAHAERLQSSVTAWQRNFTEKAFLFRSFHAPRHALYRSRADERGNPHRSRERQRKAVLRGLRGRPGRRRCASWRRRAWHARCAQSGDATAPSAASSATTRRTSLGRNGFSITGRPLAETNSRNAEARVSPVTKTTRAACPGQRCSISR